MREIRLSGSEGGVADNGHLYPYRGRVPPSPIFYPAALLSRCHPPVGPESLGPPDTPHPTAQELDYPCAEDP